MKKSYLIIILLVLVGLAYFMLGNNDKAVTDSQTVTTENQPVETAEEVESSNETVNEEESSMDETEVKTEEVVDEVSEMESTERVFTLDSFNFGYSETELRVKEGDTVTINLTNSDGFHDWVVDEFGAATEKIREGDTTSVTFVADKTGTFEYYCSVGSHRANGMVGTLIVE